MGVHKKINVMSGLAIGSAFLSFVFLIAYIATAIAYVDSQDSDVPVGPMVCLAIFIILLIVFAILDVIIGVYALMKVNKFSEEGVAWTIVGLCVVGFFFSGYIGLCCMIAVIVMSCTDKQRKKNKKDKKKEGNDTTTVTATVMTAPPPGTAYPAGAPSAYPAAQPYGAPAQPYPAAQPYGAPAQPYPAAQPYGAPPEASPY